MSRAFDLAATYIHLEDGPEAVPIEAGPEFWATLERRTELQRGRLVCVCPNRETWTSWEMHPAGDEIVSLLSGRLDLVLEEDGGERTIPLHPGATCVVPQGVWHRVIVHTPGDTLHITRGAGTRHRPR